MTYVLEGSGFMYSVNSLICVYFMEKSFDVSVCRFTVVVKSGLP